MPGRQQSEAYSRIFDSSSAAQTGPSSSSSSNPSYIASGEAGKASGPAAALFEVPCHVLPPMRTLVSQFMDVVLQSAAAGKAAEERGSGSSAAANGAGYDGSDDDDDEDEDEVVDNVVDNGRGASVAEAAAAAANGSMQMSLDDALPSTAVAAEQTQFMVSFFEQRAR